MKKILIVIVLTLGLSHGITTHAAQTATLSDLWEGRAELGMQETVNFNGQAITRDTTTGQITAHDLYNAGRVALVYADADTIYAYFRQPTLPIVPDILSAEIYVAISTDGGKNFAVQPNPIIPIPQTVAGIGTLTNAYDPDVIKLNNGYYMVFEGTSAANATGDPACGFSSYIAHSVDGLHNWQVKGVPICALTWSKSASTPSFVSNSDKSKLYIQWSEVSDDEMMATLHQIDFDLNDPFKNITTDVGNDNNEFAMSPAGAWDSNLMGPASTIYENGYYYMFFDGAPYHRCNGNWGTGLARSTDIANINSWVKFSDNPLQLAIKPDSCWISYAEIFKINGEYYLYYEDSLPNWSGAEGNGKDIYRRKIQLKKAANAAEFLQQSVPATMAAGQTYSVSITFKNNGTNNWNETNQYRLGSQNPQDNGIWRDGRVLLLTEETVRGADQNCPFYSSLGGNILSEPATASIEGRYIIAARGADNGVWVKELTLDNDVNAYNVDWYMVNNGSTLDGPKLSIERGTLWLYVKGLDGNVYRSRYRSPSGVQVGNWWPWEKVSDINFNALRSQVNSPYKAYNLNNSAALGKCVPEGQTKTFTFDVKAPATPGTYNFQWQMVQDGVEWLGDKTPNVVVAVVSSAGCTPKTCAALGNYQCGSWSDGCGAMVSCGTCTSGKTCNASGRCVSQTAGEPVISDSDPQTLTETPQKMTRAEILQKIAEVKQLLIQLIIQLIAELQKQLAGMQK
jgi:predicted GH43/DUF377 family glycosyl hydrolase